jgi:hypothetical protein
MKELSRFTKDDKTAIVKGDGGSYVVELFVNNQLVETKVFAEHTLRIVENNAKTWIENDSIG